MEGTLSARVSEILVFFAQHAFTEMCQEVQYDAPATWGLSAILTGVPSPSGVFIQHGQNKIASRYKEQEN